MKMSKQNPHTASNVILGMAAGAAVSAAGIYYATHNQKEVRKMAKKLSHTAENAMTGIDKAVNTVTHYF